MHRSRRVGTAVLLTVLSVSALGALRYTHTDSSQMVAAARSFLDALSNDQRSRAVFAFASDERLKWHFIPNESFPRSGVMLKEMTAEQRSKAEALLRTGLSQRGFLTATAIMKLEEVLQALEGGARFARDPDEYLISIFGSPSTDGEWGWRFEGHHVSLHFTLSGGEVVAAAPAFFGANPADVREGPQRGVRALAAREDAGRALLLALDASQRRTALVSDVAPRDIVTGAELEIDPLSPVGVRAMELSDGQRDLLMNLVDTYLSVMVEEIAARRLTALRSAGLDNIAFAWAGEAGTGRPHYYRVQGPTFLIEYDNTQNDANHIHSVWRDFDGDFGQDVLRDHIRERAH